MHEAQPRLGLHVFEQDTGVDVYVEELLAYDLVGPETCRNGWLIWELTSNKQQKSYVDDTSVYNRFIISFDRVEKPGIEPAITGLLGE